MFENAFDVAAVRRARAGHGERALTRGVHSRSAMLLRNADDAEHGPETHLGLRVLGHRTARDLRYGQERGGSRGALSLLWMLDCH